MNVTLLALLGMQYVKNQRIQEQIAGNPGVPVVIWIFVPLLTVPDAGENTGVIT